MIADGRTQSTEADQARREQRVEAPLAVLFAVAMQVTLSLVSLQRDWRMWGTPGWVWLVAVAPELCLIFALSVPGTRRKLERADRRRTASIALVAVIGLSNVFALVVLIGSLITAQEAVGVELLLKGGTIWGTNVIAFGLMYWEIDGDGPERRREHGNALDRDFQFPQMENPDLVAPGWQPHLIDYVYVSFTNSIAFSPTDAMPLRHRAKLLMMFQSSVSALAVLLVAARAVNILH